MLTAALVLADGLGDDVLSALDSSISIFHIALDKAFCSALGVSFSLDEEDLCQRLQSLFTSHLGSGSALRLIGQVDILQFCRVPAGVDALLQFGCHLLEVGDGLRDRLLTFLYLFQFVVTVADGGYLHLVETACPFLPVS